MEIVRPDQGEGYTGYRPAQIWIAHLDANPEKFASRKIERLTDDDYWYGDPQWSPDGKNPAFIRQWIDREKKQDRSSLWFVEGKRENARALEKDEPDARAPIFSPDGKWIAFLSYRPGQIPATPEGKKQLYVISA